MADTFAVLLRRHRVQNQLTQEMLGERAGISARSIGQMERGRCPRLKTVERLAAVLDLADDDRCTFVTAGNTRFWTNRAAEVRMPGKTVYPPRQLPLDITDFVGRYDELARLGRFLDPTRPAAGLVTISGPAGVGKTTLAVHAGHRFADRFPDGQLYATLTAANGDPADPMDVLGQLLRSFGIDDLPLPSTIDERAGLFRHRVAGQRLLIVLDAAAGHHQLVPLLPAAGAMVVTTSRIPLTGLPGAYAIDLAPLPEPQAVELLHRATGDDRVSTEPAAAYDITAACGNMPYAVRIVAARLASQPGWGIRMFADRLADERRRLDELRHGDLAVRTVLHDVHRQLTPTAARAFALLGGLPDRHFQEWILPVLLDTTPDLALAAFDELLDARLLELAGADQLGQPRYRLPELNLLFARERLEHDIDEANRRDILIRIATAWLTLNGQSGRSRGRPHAVETTTSWM